MSSYKFAPLPSMPSKGKGNRPTHPCVCGCEQGTKSTWYPGHDGRATGWAVRIEKGIMTLDDVPPNERRGAAIMLRRREGASMADAIARTPSTPTQATERKLSKAERKAAKRAAAELAKLTQATPEIVIGTDHDLSEPNVSEVIDTDLTDAEEAAS